MKYSFNFIRNVYLELLERAGDLRVGVKKMREWDVVQLDLTHEGTALTVRLDPSEGKISFLQPEAESPQPVFRITDAGVEWVEAAYIEEEQRQLKNDAAEVARIILGQVAGDDTGA